MRKILVIFTILLLILVVGCAKVQKQGETPATTQSADAGSSQSISEADSIENITDAGGSKELDSVGSTLNDW